METAAPALSDLAKEAKESTGYNNEDEWDILGKDVANTLRPIVDEDCQRRVKFAIQTDVFKSMEQQRVVAQSQVTSYDYFSNRLGNRSNLSHHDLMPSSN